MTAPQPRRTRAEPRPSCTTAAFWPAHSGKETFGVFVATRDLRFAKGRFALMGAVVTLITLLVVLLSGLTAGLGRGNTSAITDLPADHLVFSAPAAGQKLTFTDSTVNRAQQTAWAAMPGVHRADPVTVAMNHLKAGERTIAVAVFAVTPGSPVAPAVTNDHVVLTTKAAEALGGPTTDCGWFVCVSFWPALGPSGVGRHRGRPSIRSAAGLCNVLGADHQERRRSRRN